MGRKSAGCMGIAKGGGERLIWKGVCFQGDAVGDGNLGKGLDIVGKISDIPASCLP